MTFQHEYRLIPIDVCKYAILSKKTRTVQIYFILNITFSGKCKLSSADISRISDQLKITPKTFKSHLTKLIGWNWIGFNPKSGYCHIRGINHIHRSVGVKTRSASEFMLKEITHFKEYCIATFVAYLINRQKSERFRSERQEARSNQNRDPNDITYNYVCLSVLANFLQISKSSASRYIRLAAKKGYLKVDHVFTPLLGSHSGIPVSNYRDPRIRIRNKQVVIQEPNRMEHNLHLKRRKKLEP